MKRINHLNTLSLAVMSATLWGCSPSIHLIDRQTILEIEASGDWQELDRKFQDQEVASGPLPLEKTKTKGDRRKVFSMTHSDKNNENSKQQKSESKTPATNVR
jgi:hypothetical protein